MSNESQRTCCVILAILGVVFLGLSPWTGLTLIAMAFTWGTSIKKDNK